MLKVICLLQQLWLLRNKEANALRRALLKSNCLRRPLLHVPRLYVGLSGFENITSFGHFLCRTHVSFTGEALTCVQFSLQKRLVILQEILLFLQKRMRVPRNIPGACFSWALSAQQMGLRRLHTSDRSSTANS